MTISLETLVGQARGNDAVATRAAAKLMSVLENEPQRLPEFLRAAGAETPQPRLILGITGAPGAGKSTFSDALIGEYRRRAPAQKIGVIAVDPSSPFSGGAVLGDRVRMMRHATDPHVFVRSLASRGQLGGLTLGVKGVLRVMGLIGADVVLIETLGVGQSEVDVARVADIVMVLLSPGQGDSVQLLKAGLMEVGDIIVINKADRAGADELHRQVLGALKLQQGTAKRSVALVSSTEKSGFEELLNRIEDHGALHPQRRRENDIGDIREAILEAARRRIIVRLKTEPTLHAALERVARGGEDAESLVQLLLKDGDAPST